MPVSDELHCLVPTSRTLDPKGDGTLGGHSVVIKDLIAVKGHVSSFGHPQWRLTHDPSKENAEIIDRLLDNGASVKGITKLDQLAYSMIGNAGEGDPPINTLYRDRFTGGSSSGSASAVAGGIVDIGIGTDTGGSIRVPAAACGLFGMRPTHASISSIGVLPLAQSYDVVGALTRSAAILSKTIDMLIGDARENKDEITQILIPIEAKQVEKPLFNIVQHAGEFIGAKLNAQIKIIDISDFISPSSTEIFPRLQGREIWSNHHEWVVKNMAHLAEDVKARLERCKLWSESSMSEKNQDEARRAEYTRKLEALVSKTTLLILPVIPTLMPLRTSSIQEQLDFRSKTVGLIAPASLSGMPEAVIPVYDRMSGITIGVGVLSARGSDKLLGKTLIKIAGEQRYIEV